MDGKYYYMNARTNLWKISPHSGCYVIFYFQHKVLQIIFTILSCLRLPLFCRCKFSVDHFTIVCTFSPFSFPFCYIIPSLLYNFCETNKCKIFESTRHVFLLFHEYYMNNFFPDLVAPTLVHVLATRFSSTRVSTKKASPFLDLSK